MGLEEKAPERERRDWIIILVILLFGFLCVGLAGQWAIRFAPNWKLNTNMGSNIDPNSDFLTNRPNEFIEPVDPAILTNAIWVDLYQTPGAVIPTSIAPLLSTPTEIASPTAVIVSSSTSTTVPLPTPTNTTIYYPPPLPTNTKKPPPPAPSPTNTSVVVTADLQITKTDYSTDYAANALKVYTITVSNAGPSDVTGATVTDIFSSNTNISNVAGWGCLGTGGATCTLLGTGDINDTVDLPAGSSVTYIVSVNISASPSGDLVNTATVTEPVGVTDPLPGNNFSTDTDTLIVSTADLQVTITDYDDFFSAGNPIQYTIVVSNPVGTSGVTGASVSGTFDVSLLTNINWNCVPSGSATCTANGSGGLSDSVDLPVGTSVTYTVNATVVGSPGGNLLTTSASVTAPVGVTDPNISNNTAQDQDGLAPAEIGTTPDGNIYIVPSGPSGTNLDIRLGKPLQVNGNPGWDLIYYEWPQASGILMDAVELYVSVDGITWFGPILSWGVNPAADSNTNIPVPLLTNPPGNCAGEPDNCEIASSLLYNNTGVAIDVDGMVPPGTYYYLRIYSPPNPPDNGDGTELDAIQILP